MDIRKVLPPFAILIVATLYYFTSPHDGNFWWSDAPRHAMDGVFYADFFKALPADPKQYAFDYYSRYPALTILFYPPMFAVVEAAFFALFGQTHAVAQVTVSFFVLIAGLGAYQLATRCLSPVKAFAVALLFLGSNEIAYWGRQVMLDIPAYACLLWTAVAYLKYVDTQKPIFVYLTCALFAIGIYTKLNIAFMAPVFFGVLAVRLGRNVFDRHILLAVLFFCLAMVPWLFVTVKYGQVNIGAAAGGQVSDEFSRTSLDNWLYYAKLIPRQIGIIPGLLSVAYIFSYPVYKHDKLGKLDYYLYTTWLIFGYILFSLIALKESRHGIFLLYPFAIFSVLFIDRFLKSELFSCAAALLLAATLFVRSIFFTEVPYVDGYQEAADYATAHAPTDSAILFSGYRDGSFVFNVKSHSERPDLSVIRADKILLKVAIKREMGVEEKAVEESEIVDMLNNNGVSYLVIEPDFWIDLPVMQKLQGALKSAQFEKVKTININTNTVIKDKHLYIYKNTKATKKNSGNIEIEIPSIGITINEKK